MTRGTWTDNPCWYVSVRDAGRTGLLLGPFATEAGCRMWAYRSAGDGGDPNKHVHVRAEAERGDAWAVFYSFGMVKMSNGHYEGILNKLVEGWEDDSYPGPTKLWGLEPNLVIVDDLPKGEGD